MRADEYEQEFGGTSNGTQWETKLKLHPTTLMAAQIRPGDGQALVRMGGVTLIGSIAEVERAMTTWTYAVHQLNGHVAEAEQTATALPVPSYCGTCQGMHASTEPHLRRTEDELRELRGHAYGLMKHSPFVDRGRLPYLLVDAAAYFIRDGLVTEARTLLHTYITYERAEEVITDLLAAESVTASPQQWSLPPADLPAAPPPSGDHHR